MDPLYLIATIAGQRVALAAEMVEAVVELDAIVPVPRVPPHVAGLAALRSRVLTIIDCMASLGLGETPRSGRLPSVIVTIDGHHYGLLVDDVLDVVAISGAPRPANLSQGGGWARVARMIVEQDGKPLLLLDAAALIAGPAAVLAA